MINLSPKSALRIAVAAAAAIVIAGCASEGTKPPEAKPAPAAQPAPAEARPAAPAAPEVPPAEARRGADRKPTKKDTR